MRVLYVTNELPFPLDRGAPIRTYQLLRWLAMEHEIVMLTLTTKSPEELRGAVAELSTYCAMIETFPARDLGALDQPLRALRFASRGVPIDLRAFVSPALSAALRRTLAARPPDVIAIEHPSMMLYLEDVPEALRSRTVLLAHDVDFSKYRRMARLEPRLARRLRLRLHAAMLRRWEPCMAERFGCYTTVSVRDRELLIAQNPRVRVQVIPNGVDVDAMRRLPEATNPLPPRLLFLGNLGYRPNIDGVTWLVRDILPLVRASIPEVQLDVVGVSATEEVTSLAGPSVHVLGAVPDVRPAYQSAHVCLVPLRAGGGTRLKILEAMALGRPIVTTSIGCEGIAAEDGVHVLVADDEASFAAKTVELLKDGTRRQAMATAARNLVERRYDWRSLAAKLTEVFTSVAPQDALLDAHA